LQGNDIYYATATTDFNYKNLVGHVEGMADVVCRCLLRIQFPGKTLFTRRVRIVGEHIDANSKNVWAALSSSIKGMKDPFGEIHKAFDASIKGKGKIK
jgi:hypothetical protein